MKTGMYTGKEAVTIRDTEIPDCDAEDVLIENLYAAVCDEDVSLFLNGPGKNANPEGPFGLSAVSQVTECGYNALDFNLGERVFALYPDSGSAFSEFSLIKNAAYNQNLYPIPDSISDQTACLIRPFVHGCHAARSAMRLRPAEEVYCIAAEHQPYQGDIRYADGDSAIVFGDNISALATGISLLWFGMEKVMICGSSPLHLELAKKAGMLSCNAASLALTVNDSLNSYDCWIDTTGSAAVLSYYNQYGKEGSRFISASETCEPAIMDMKKLTAEGRSITGAGGFTGQDVQETISILASGIWDFSIFFTQEYSIDDLEEALETAADPESSCCVGIHF